MFYGEFSALRALEANDPRSGHADWVYAGLAVGFMAVCLLLIFRPLSERTLSNGR